MNPLICIPFDISHMDVLGQDGGPTAAKQGYARSAIPTRYTTFAIKWTQGAVGGDFVADAPQSINLLGGGVPPDGSQGTADSSTPFGYPTNFGVLTERESNLYIGGRPCVTGMEYVMCAFGVRPLQVWVMGTVDDPPALGMKYGAWTNVYQSQIQQAGLDNQLYTFQLSDDTCSLELSTAPHAPNPNSSGNTTLVAQNGEQLRYNVNPLCKCLVISNKDGTSPNANLNVVTQRQLVEYFVAIGGTPPASAVVAAIVSEFQVDLWGYCRWGCNEDVRGCLASIACRTAGDDWRLGLCGNTPPSPQQVTRVLNMQPSNPNAGIPTPP